MLRGKTLQLRTNTLHLRKTLDKTEKTCYMANPYACTQLLHLPAKELARPLPKRGNLELHAGNVVQGVEPVVFSKNKEGTHAKVPSPNRFIAFYKFKDLVYKSFSLGCMLFLLLRNKKLIKMHLCPAACAATGADVQKNSRSEAKAIFYESTKNEKEEQKKQQLKQ